MERIQIVRLVSQSTPEVDGGAGINEDVWYIAVIHAKEAKYMLKRPIVNVNLTSCLTKDDTDLRVTIGHIR
jgi:hypothetical protein